MRHFLFKASLCLFPFLCSSCADDSLDFQRDEIDTTIQVGGEHFAVPLGRLEKITAADLVEDFNVPELTVRSEDGLCVFSYSSSSSVDLGAIEPIHVDDVAFDYSEKVELPGLLSQSAVPASVYRLPVNIPISYHFKVDDLPPEVSYVKEVGLSKTYARGNLRFSGLEPLMSKKLHFDGDIIFPDRVALGGEYAGKHRVPVSEDITEKGIDFSVEYSSVAFDGAVEGTSIDLVEQIVVDGVLSADLTAADLSGLGSSFEFLFKMGIRNIVPEYIELRMDYSQDFSEVFPLYGMPEELMAEGVVMDLLNPYFLIDLKHNLSFGADMDLTLTSRKDYKDLGSISVSTSIEKASDRGAVSYVLAQNKDYIVEPFDVFVEGQTARLLNPVPAEIAVDAHLKVDDARDLLFYFGRDYRMDMDYHMVAPMVFGKDFCLEMIKDVPVDSVTVGLPEGPVDIALLAKLENTLPASIELSGYALDADGRRLNLEIGKFGIASCSADGSAVHQEFEIPVTGESSMISRMTALRLFIRFEDGDAAGIPLMGDDYFSGVFALRIAGGITVDLGELQQGSR